MRGVCARNTASAWSTPPRLFIVNVEHWHSAHALRPTVLPPPMGHPLLPDVPHWCWHTPTWLGEPRAHRSERHARPLEAMRSCCGVATSSIVSIRRA